MKNLTGYWISNVDNKFMNYGDVLTPYIFDKYDINLTYSSHDPQIYGIGSLLHMIDDNYKGYIWSTGFMYPTKFLNFEHSPICVRGKLSKNQFQNDTTNTYIGDGCLILDRIYKPKVNKKYKLGIFPNYCDIVNMKDDPIYNFDLLKREDVLFIDPRDYIESVINNVNSCENVITSSLHGAITCDSYNINHGIFCARETKLAIHICQGSFKFKDYYSTFDTDFNSDNILYLDNSLSFEKCISACKQVNKPSLESIKDGIEKSIEIIKNL